LFKRYTAPVAQKAAQSAVLDSDALHTPPAPEILPEPSTEIKSVSDPEPESETPESDLSRIEYLDEEGISNLRANGVNTVSDFIAATPSLLASILGWTVKRVKLIRDEASKL